MSVCFAIAHQSLRQPEKVALSYGNEEITYGALEARVGAAASHLKALGVDEGSRIGVALFDTPDHVIALLALGRLGATAVPIDYRAAATQKKDLCEAFGVATILCSRKSKTPSANEVVFSSVEFDDAPLAHQPGRLDRTFLINFSSGSTGLPKPVYMTEQQLYHRCVTWWTHLEMTPDLVYLSVLPLAYSFGRNYLLFSLIAGQTVVMHDPLFRDEELVSFINQQPITLAMFPATIHRRLLAIAGTDGYLMPHLKKLVSGAAPLHAHEKIAIADKINPNFFEVYGHNGAGLMSVLPPADVKKHSASVGVTTSLSHIQIVDDEDRVLPMGEVGRVRSRGPQIAADNEEVDQDAPWPWCYTGEMGVLDCEGRLMLRDRADDMIVTGGFKVFPLEVEKVLLQHEGVKDAAVVGLSSQRDGQDVAAFLVVKDGVELSSVRELCRTQLTPYKVPRRFFCVEVIPKSAASKVLRRELIENIESYQEVSTGES